MEFYISFILIIFRHEVLNMVVLVEDNVYIIANFLLDKTQRYKYLGMPICSHVRQVRIFWLLAGKLASL